MIAFDENGVSNLYNAKKILIKDGKCRCYFIGKHNKFSAHVFYKTNRLVQYEYFDHGTEEEAIGWLESNIYTDEELVSPCNSLKEHNKRVKFFIEHYIKQVEVRCSHYEDTLHNENYIPFPMTKDLYASVKDKEFVDHCCWLWSKLQKLKRPTIFPEFLSGIYATEKAVNYIQLIPFAEPDDMSLTDVQEYLSEYGSKLAKKAYEDNRIGSARKLVQGGYVNKSMLEKLLEMANDKNDAKFAALLIDSLGNNCGRESQFSL